MILLCHEKDITFCHRRIVAEWLEAALGIKVPEMENALKKMKMIYDREGEYADLGLNLYPSCSHDCRYCYSKRADRYQGPYDKPAVGATLKNIEHDLQILQSNHDRRPVHISFVGDPYDLGRKDFDKPKGLIGYFSEDDRKANPNANDSYVRSVLKTFRAYDQPFQILTKGGMLAAKDFELYSSNDKFGVTLTFDNDADSRRWEPGAALSGDRIAALQEAHSRGIRTWVSMEPVIYPEQTLRLIEMTHEFVDLFWIGKLNRKPEATWIRASEWPIVDWPKFRSDVEALLLKCGKQQGTGYKLKNQLIEAK